METKNITIAKSFLTSSVVFLSVFVYIVLGAPTAQAIQYTNDLNPNNCNTHHTKRQLKIKGSFL